MAEYSPSPLNISVEGNIGSGKTTFLKFCSADETFEPLYEPVEKWRNVGGVNMLEKFYEDPVKWGFAFQMEVNITLLQRGVQESTRPIRLLERSLLCARNCFQKSMLANNLMEPVMGSVLNFWHDFAETHCSTRSHAIVYIRTTPAVAYNRVKTRARNEEDTVSLAYLTEIHNLHEVWLSTLHQQNLVEAEDTSIFIIDGDQPIEALEVEYNQTIQAMKSLLL